MEVIAISNQKGGCGKTTSSINIAASLAALGKKTLLIDLDPQAHATYGLNIRHEKIPKTIYDVLTTSDERRVFLEDTIIPLNPQLDLVPSQLLLSTIEQEFNNKDEAVSKLSEVLDRLCFPYEFVVLDCPPNLGFLTFNALRAADIIVVPIELSSFSLAGVGKLLSMIELLRVKLNHTPHVYALPTMVDMRTRFSKYMLKEIKKSFNDNIFKSAIRQGIAVRESQAKGLPLLHYNAKAKATQDYQRLADEIIEKIAGKKSAQRQLDEKTGEDIPEKRACDFTFQQAEAREIYLVGDFNNWSISPDSMLWKKEEGTWHKKVLLSSGRYRYKYVVDGQWMPDPSNKTYEPNAYGTMDSILEVA